MNNFDIPIFKKSYDLYKTFYSYRKTVNKQDRHTIWQKSENIILGIIEDILLASQQFKTQKLPILENLSLKINFIKVFLRLSKDLKIIDNNKYIILQEDIDEIGKMTGGWIKSIKS